MNFNSSANPFNHIVGYLSALPQGSVTTGPVLDKDRYFVYTYPSTMLQAAINAKREFNIQAKGRRSVMVIVQDLDSKKVAVFPSINDCSEALGYGSRDKLMDLARRGFCPERKMLFCILDQNNTELKFQSMTAAGCEKDRRKSTIHVIATHRITGEKRLYAGPHMAAKDLDITRYQVDLLLLGRTTKEKASKWSLKPATMQAIHEHFPNYVPESYRYAIATTDDYQKFITEPYQEHWGATMRTSHYHHHIVPAWNQLKKKLGLIA